MTNFDSPQDIADMIEMTIDALSDCQDPELRPKLEKRLADLQAATPGAVQPRNEDEFRGRRGGEAAANQYGTFAVHHASEKQVAFIRRLISEKDTTGLKIPADLDTISKTSASALIDRLLNARPKGAPTSSAGGGDPKGTFAPQVRSASEKQVAFVKKLLGEKDLSGTLYAGVWVDGVVDPRTGEHHFPADHMTSTEASANIDHLLTLPNKPKPVAREVEAGAYRVDGRIIRVYLGQQSGRMLAAELVDAAAETHDEAWKYLGQADRHVPAGSHRLTAEEAEEASASQADHSWCCVCGRRLDDPNSVARSIGPVCRAKQG